MIRALTVKELSADAGERSEQIPRIAGNWFKEESGYLWRLREDGVIKDVGRQYALDRERLAADFVADLDVQRCFPDHHERGKSALPSDAYRDLVGDMTWGGLQRRLAEEVFAGETMQELFRFDLWRETLLQQDEREHRISRYRLVLDFWSCVHYMVLSAVFTSRRRHLTERLNEQESYFRWRNRRQRLDEARDELRHRLVRNCFPGAAQDVDGTYVDDTVQAVAERFGRVGPVLSEDAADLLANVYLLSFHDGPALFEQYAKYDHEVNLLFNLLERGWMVQSRYVEEDPRTGNVVVPLHQMHSYLDRLAGLFDAA